jgi:hypothetical protein
MPRAPGLALETWEKTRTPLFPYFTGAVATDTSESAQP